MTFGTKTIRDVKRNSNKYSENDGYRTSAKNTMTLLILLQYLFFLRIRFCIAKYRNCNDFVEG